ncbi:MAG: hypothetical protein ACYSN8_04190 [Planctomycetota bacterium]|jgi:hypothetical protein
MSISPEYSVEKPNALGQIEQSASITPQVSRKKKDAKSKKEKRRHRPTIDEQLEQESAEHRAADDKNEHVDFCA